MSLPAVTRAAGEEEQLSTGDGEATDESFSGFGEMNKPRPSLIPFILEALKAQPNGQ